jgi:hypothetical protein
VHYEDYTALALELIKASPVLIKSLGLGEKWLQDQIQLDPTLLGLGELEVAFREHRQPLGGRIDFLMRNIEGDTFYEVEIMLGALDESHIIRAIEYWDIERQRRPSYQHRAVIVAEQITARFFNVVRILNRAVPLIAIKLTAFKSGENNVILHAVTVLDIVEEIVDDHQVDQAEQSDRTYWEKKSTTTLAIMDKIVLFLKSKSIEPRVTYNRHHIALGSKTGRNFCWFHPRKAAGRCHIELRVKSDSRDTILSHLQADGLDATPRDTREMTFAVTLLELEKHTSLVTEVLELAVDGSH